MNKKPIILLLGCLLLASNLYAAEEQVARFEIVVFKDSEVLETAEIWTRFGQAGDLTVSDVLRLTVMASEPEDGLSTISGEFYYAHDGEMVLEWAPSMTADLTQTPSFEHSSQETGYRVEVRPSLATLPE